jgi:hypothetical protein
MVAYDVTTIVRDGMVHVDPSLNGRQVRVVVLADDIAEPTSERQIALARLFKNRLRVSPFVPLTRDEANART